MTCLSVFLTFSGQSHVSAINSVNLLYIYRNSSNCKLFPDFRYKESPDIKNAYHFLLSSFITASQLNILSSISKANPQHNIKTLYFPGYISLLSYNFHFVFISSIQKAFRTRFQIHWTECYVSFSIRIKGRTFRNRHILSSFFLQSFLFSCENFSGKNKIPFIMYEMCYYQIVYLLIYIFYDFFCCSFLFFLVWSCVTLQNTYLHIALHTNENVMFQNTLPMSYLWEEKKEEENIYCHPREVRSSTILTITMSYFMDKRKVKKH